MIHTPPPVTSAAARSSCAATPGSTMVGSMEAACATTASIAGPMWGRTSPGPRRPWAYWRTSPCAGAKRCATPCSTRYGRERNPPAGLVPRPTAGWPGKWVSLWRTAISATLISTSSGRHIGYYNSGAANHRAKY